MLGEDEQLLNVECVVISHPNSGRYWLRDILHFYDGSLPTVAFTHDIMEPTFDDVLKWRDLIVVDQIPLVTLGRRLAYGGKKIIIITRDPRDVIVSYYYQKTAREPLLFDLGIIDICPDFTGGLHKFILDDVYGLRHLLTFMNILAPYILAGAYKLNYEAMHKDTLGEMKKVFAHLGVDEIDEQNLTKAIQSASFEERQKEEIKTFGDIGNAKKHRKGGVGGYKEEMDERTLNVVNNYIEVFLHQTYGEYIREGAFNRI